MVTFGERLRKMRREAGLSQGDLAGDELSASYISLLEANKRTPSLEVINLLAARLRCSSTQLFEGKASDRDQRIDLEMAYAKLAIEHGESLDAKNRLERLLTEEGIPFGIRDEAALLLGTSHERLGDHFAAVRVLSPLLDRACAGDSPVSVIHVGLVLCRAYLDSGSLNRAAVCGEQALGAAKQQLLSGTNDYFRLAATVMSVFMQMGDLLHARAWADSFIAEAMEAGEVAGQAALYWNSALLAEQEGRIEDAVRLCEWALTRLSELDNLRDYARVRLAFAYILLGMDAPDAHRASELLDRLLPDLQDLGSRVDLGHWNRDKSMALLHEGDTSGAEGRARQAIDLFLAARPLGSALAWMSLSDALIAQNRAEEAADCRAEAMSRLHQEPGGRTAALAWRELAERMADAGDADGAVEAFRQAMDAAGVRDRSRSLRAAARQLSQTTEFSATRTAAE